MERHQKDFKNEPVCYEDIMMYLTAKGMGRVFEYQDTAGKMRKSLYIGDGAGKPQPEKLRPDACESLIINDPNSAGYSKMGKAMKRIGYVVRHLDVTNPLQSHSWNCMNAIQPKTCGKDAHMIATTIVMNLSEDTAIDSVFSASQVHLLEALLLYVALDPHRSPEQKTLCAVYDLLTNPAGDEFFDDAFSPAKLMKEQAPAAEPYLLYRAVDPNLRIHILAALKDRLHFLHNSNIRGILSGNEIDLTLPGDQPCMYFCTFEKGDPASTVLAALFYTMGMASHAKNADGQPNGRSLMHVTFMLEDFPLYGIIPELEMRAMTMRKRNMGMSIALEMAAVV